MGVSLAWWRLRDPSRVQKAQLAVGHAHVVSPDIAVIRQGPGCSGRQLGRERTWELEGQGQAAAELCSTVVACLRNCVRDDWLW